jgi:hypothetical protein
MDHIAGCARDMFKNVKMWVFGRWTGAEGAEGKENGCSLSGAK